MKMMGKMIPMLMRTLMKKPETMLYTISKP